MIIIDTHILIWWVNGDKCLSNTVAKAIERAIDSNGEVIISAISAWEVTMLIQKGRLILNMDIENWLDEIAHIDGVRFAPIDSEIALKSALLPGNFHKDPADRMIVATARKLAIPLATADKKILAYEHVKTIW